MSRTKLMPAKNPYCVRLRFPDAKDSSFLSRVWRRPEVPQGVNVGSPIWDVGGKNFLFPSTRTLRRRGRVALFFVFFMVRTLATYSKFDTKESSTDSIILGC